MAGSNPLRSLALKILAAPVAVFLVGVLVPGAVAYRLLQDNADRETHEKAVALLQTLQAVQHYADEKVQPRFDAAGAGAPEATGAFAAREVAAQYARAGGEVPARLRVVAANPTNPANAADAYETRLIAAMDADHRLGHIEEETSKPDGRYRVLAAPIVVSGEACLRCHGSPDAAPSERVRAFGKTGGYGWRRGQVVGASLVYVPADFADQQAGQIFWTTFKIVAVLALLCCAILGWQTYSWIVTPARRMLEISQAIRRGEWKARYVLTRTDEMALLAQSFQDTTHWLREQVAREEKLRSMFQQFIPASVAARALGKNADVVLAGTKHTVTVMIINIRNFKLLMEHLPAGQTVTTLNEYFAEVNKVIVANKGLVSRYMGDSVMAFFGMPVDTDEHALNAIRAALEIPRALQNLYVRLEENYGWELGVGVGISSGEPIVGHFGSSEHMEYTVLGEVVQEAQWLEDVSKSVPEEDTILITEATYRRVMSDVHVYEIGERATADGHTVHAYAVQGLRSEARSQIAA